MKKCLFHPSMLHNSSAPLANSNNFHKKMNVRMQPQSNSVHVAMLCQIRTILESPRGRQRWPDSLDVVNEGVLHQFVGLVHNEQSNGVGVQSLTVHQLTNAAWDRRGHVTDGYPTHCERRIAFSGFEGEQSVTSMTGNCKLKIWRLRMFSMVSKDRMIIKIVESESHNSCLQTKWRWAKYVCQPVIYQYG